MGNVEPALLSESSQPAPPPPAHAALSTLAPLFMAYLAFDQGEYAELKSRVRELAKRDPLDALLVTVLGGGLAFYALEREHNPGIEGPMDAILYIATSLSVGYDNLFPRTPLGHALATAVHSLGPALTNAAFEPPAAAAPEEQLLAVNQAILARLDDIAKLLADKDVPERVG